MWKEPQLESGRRSTMPNRGVFACSRPGTEGSNPSPSSRESATNSARWPPSSSDLRSENAPTMPLRTSVELAADVRGHLPDDECGDVGIPELVRSLSETDVGDTELSGTHSGGAHSLCWAVTKSLN